MSPAPTPYISATWVDVIPYFSQARMRAISAAGMAGSFGGSARVGAAGSSLVMGAAAAILSTRGLRTASPAGATASRADGPTRGGFGANSASAA
jgi:hypothetical protein